MNSSKFEHNPDYIFLVVYSQRMKRSKNKILYFFSRFIFHSNTGIIVLKISICSRIRQRRQYMNILR